MDVNQLFPKKYACGADLNGKPATLTILRVAPEKMRPGPGSPETTKYVVYFENAKKAVILNRTLAFQIAAALGEPDTDRWTGKAITLYPENCVVAGTPRIAIRARAAAPQPVATPAPNGNGNQPQPQHANWKARNNEQ